VILAIDTATAALSAALGEGGAVVDESTISSGRAHLELLLPEVERLLKRSSRTIRDIDGIVVGTGPGAFSGLRVGIATARGLAQALGVPIQGCSSLDALAMPMAEALEREDTGLLPLIDAKRGQVFTRLYRPDRDGTPVPASAFACLDPEAVGPFAAEHGSGVTLAGGEGALAYRSAIEKQTGIRLLAGEDPRNLVSAAAHIRLAGTGGTGIHRDMEDVLPLYVREPDADKTVLLRKRPPWLT